MNKIEITSNHAELKALFEKLVRRVQDPTPLMAIIGRKLHTRVVFGFRRGVDPYGKPWKPLKFRSGQPLRDTGRLQNSITFRADRKGITIGTNVCYAPPHQFGAVVEAGKPPHQSLCGYVTKGSPVLRFEAGGKVVYAKKVTIPARPFLPDAQRGLPDEWADDIRASLNAYLGELGGGRAAA